MNHQNSKGCFGNQIDLCGISNIEILKDGEEENTNQNSTEFVGIRYEEGQRESEPEFYLQECEQDDAEITGK